MACLICEGLLGQCPVCGETNKRTHSSWEERLDSRRHMGSHDTGVTMDHQPVPAAHGFHSIDNGGFKGAAKYSRAWNSKYDGPGKGSW